jgi:hypothetical protein
MNDEGYLDYAGTLVGFLGIAIAVGVIAFYLQWNPFVPMVDIYGTTTTDTITISDKILDANNNWYEIITTDKVKYLTDPRNLSEQVKINYTYFVTIKKEQIKANIRGGMWQNTTYITSLELIDNEQQE